MPIFNPKPHHTYVGGIYSERRKRREEDHDVYFDSESQRFFVVESTEYDSPSGVTCNHITRQLSNEALEAILTEHPDLLDRVNTLRGQS